MIGKSWIKAVLVQINAIFVDLSDYKILIAISKLVFVLLTIVNPDCKLFLGSNNWNLCNPVLFHDSSGLRNGWQIISPGKSFAVYAATGTEKAEWMAHINKCIDDLVAKSMFFGFWWLWIWQYLLNSSVEIDIHYNLQDNTIGSLAIHSNPFRYFPDQFSAGKRSTKEHAAVWVPDSDAVSCMHCQKTKFTAINRRVIWHLVIY